MLNNSVRIMSEWVEKYDCRLISPKRVLPTSIIASNIFNPDERNLIFAFGASTLWLFGVDRWFDEVGYKNQDVFSKFSFLSPSVFDKEQSWDEKEIAQTYGDLFGFLTQFENFTSLQHRWISTLYDVLFLGMAHERTNQKVKTFEEYLYFGRESIGVKFVNFTTFVSMGRELRYRDYLYFDALQNISAEIIRLMNDLVTNPKEIGEGKLNVLSILDGKVERPTDWVKNVIIEKEKQLGELVSTATPELEKFAGYVLNLVKTTLSFYRDSDFYDEARSLEQKHIRKSG